MADWYVFQHDGEYLGPWTTEVVANAILSGKLAPDAWVAAPGGPRWLRALDVPVIARLIESVPTRPKRRDSGLRLMPGAYTVTNGRPAFGSTVMMVTDDELEPVAPSSRSADETRKMPVIRTDEDEIPTDPALPPSSSSATATPTPTPPEPRPAASGGPTLESPGNTRRRRAR